MMENSTRYITIDTCSALEYLEEPFMYHVQLPEKIRNIKAVSINTIEIPVTYYNICSQYYSNFFRVTEYETGKVDMIILPDNNYTSVSVAETIQDIFKFKNVDINISVNANNLIEFRSRNYYTIDFNTDIQGTLLTAGLNYKLGWLLGFRNAKYVLVKKLESQRPCNFTRPRYLYLEIFNDEHEKTLFTSSLIDCKTSKYIIARVVTDAKNFPYGSVIPANLSNGMLLTGIRKYIEPIHIKNLKFRISNEFGIPINLNGFDFSFCMQIE
jgi:hypothetical protein